MKVLRLLPRFRVAARQIDLIEKREQWTRSELEAWQLDRLNGVWRHAIDHVPFYQAMLRREGLPRKFRSIDEYTSSVPLLEKPTICRSGQQMLSDEPRPGEWRLTGGSTGSPTQTYCELEAHRETLWSRYRVLADWGVDMLDREAMLWGRAAELMSGWPGYKARLKRMAIDWLRGRLRLSAYHLGRDDLRRHLKAINDYRPVHLYGYSSALFLLAKEAGESGIRCPSLKVCTLSGEPAYRRIVETIERALGVPATSEYGSMECGIVANEGPDRTLKVREDMKIVETLPTADGKHEIVVTMLNNASFPLLRYRVGDLTDTPISAPERGFARLGEIIGRSTDMLRARSGRIVHSLCIQHLMMNYPTVRRFSGHQTADGEVRVYVESDSGFGDVARRDLTTRLSAMLEGYPVQVQEVPDSITGTLSGKHRWLVSELVETG